MMREYLGDREEPVCYVTVLRWVMLSVFFLIQEQRADNGRKPDTQKAQQEIHWRSIEAQREHQQQQEQGNADRPSLQPGHGGLGRSG